MPYEPLHQKYRPQTFADLVGQEAIATTLTNAIVSEKIAPAYLFTGPRGTGKTSSARILAKSLNCLHSDKPTAEPCGVCDVCQGVTRGSSLDVIEIDAASNTGVDNIRELIERSQFAPVQCRYKVYVIDECLTGDSLVQTSEGLMPIGDPNIKGKKVLSYNDSSRAWEYKKVIRWLDQGERQTLVIKTTNREIRCTGNHLIRTEQGWIAARNVKEGARILSPVPADAACSFTNLGWMDAPGDLLGDISLKATHTGKNHTTWALSWNRRKPCDLSVLVDVEKNLMSPPFYKKKEEVLEAYSLTGQNIHTKKHMDFGTFAQKSLFPRLKFFNRKHWDLSTEPYWETVALHTPPKIADFLDWLGHTQKSRRNGCNTKLGVFRLCDHSYELYQIKDTEINQFVVTPAVIPNSIRCLTLLNQKETKKSSQWTGLSKLPQKDLLGGSWMMGHLASVQKEAPRFNFTQRDTPVKKIKSLPVGLQTSVILQQQGFTQGVEQARSTITSTWMQTPVENGWKTLNSIPSQQWTTSLEKVESVRLAGVEKVYDIEVEDNHNFVANGLCLHNCHMLSTAAFNALLKTLEEPPRSVVFVLATTDPQRVLPTIISRCQRFDFRRISLEAMVTHLQAIATKENIDITREAVHLVASCAQGGLRDAESLLDQLSLLSSQVTVERVWDLVGSVAEPDLLELLDAIAQSNPEALLDVARRIMDRGREPLTLLQNLASFYRDLLIAKTAPKRKDLVNVTALTWQALLQQAKVWDVSSILQKQQHLAKSEAQIKNTTQPRLWLEVTLLGLLPDANSTQPSILPTQPSRQLQNLNTGLSRNQSQPQPKINEVPLQDSELPTLVDVAQSIPAPSTENLQPIVEQGEPDAPVPALAKTEEVKSISSISEQDTNESSATEFSTENVWQQVLAQLQPSSTRAILRQISQLIEFNSTVARIGMKSQSWCDKSKSYIPNIKAAFQAAFKQEVQIVLELVTLTPSKSTSVKEVLVTNKASIPVASPAIGQPIDSQITVTASDRVQTMIQRQSDAQVESIPVATPPKIDAIPDATTTLTPWDDDESLIAAQRLADSFNGAVVNPEDDPFTLHTTDIVTPPVNYDGYNVSTEDENDFDEF